MAAAETSLAAKDFASYVVILVTAWAVIRVVLTPLLDDTMFTTWEKRKNRARVRDLLDKALADRFKKLDETVEKTRVNADRLEFVEEAIARQGEALTREVARAMQQVSEASREQTVVMERMQMELATQGKAMAAMEQTLKFILRDRESA